MMYLFREPDVGSVTAVRLADQSFKPTFYYPAGSPPMMIYGELTVLRAHFKKPWPNKQPRLHGTSDGEE